MPDSTSGNQNDAQALHASANSADNAGEATPAVTHVPRQPLEISELYTLLVESVRDYALFVLDPDGYVLTWNAGAQRAKGYAAHEIIGKHFSVFYTDADRAAGKPAAELKTAVERGRVEDEGWRVRKDGTRFWANVVITALRERDGELVGFAKVTRDMTERRAAEVRALDDARRIAQVEAANKAKTEFLAAMSHELRTPLNAISGYTDLLLLEVKGQLGREQRDYLQRVRRSAQHLLGIINDLLNFSRIESGNVTYDMIPMSLAEAVREVLPMVEPQALTRGVRMSFEGGPDVCAHADPSKVEQILLNLLSNAVKFTARDGSITIAVFADGEQCGVRVADTGIGIPLSKQDAIFEPFVQVGRTHSSVSEGTGLGLAISRDLARAMQGNLVVQSAPHGGSTFTLRLRCS